MDTLRIIPLTIFCVLISVNTWAAPPTYRAIHVTSGTDLLQATGLNNNGDVVFNEGDDFLQGFVFNYASGAENALPFFDSLVGVANGISDSGRIVGYQCCRSAGPPTVPLLWSPTGGVEALQSGGFLYAFGNAVNNSGLVVGQGSLGIDPGNVALMWSGPQHTLALLPGISCDSCVVRNAEALAVNNPGHIVGVSDYSSGNHAVEWQDGHVTDLGGLNGSNNSIANGINDKDDIVGMSTVGSTGPSHAFLYRHGKMLDLGTLEGDTESYALSINNRGEIVGSSYGPNTLRAFVYVNGQMYDLNELIDPPFVGDVQLDYAVAINSAGWILAEGVQTFFPGNELGVIYLLIPNVTP